MIVVAVVPSKRTPSPLVIPAHHATKRASTPCTQAQMSEENQEEADEDEEEEEEGAAPLLFTMMGERGE